MVANAIPCRFKALGNANDAVEFNEIWKILSSSLREIHTKNASKLSFEELYRNAYKLVLKKKGEALYNKVQEFEEEWLTQEIRPRILANLSPILLMAQGETSLATLNEKGDAGERFLKGLKDCWEDHILCMNMTTDVLMYMDRVYCTDTRKPSIFVTALGQFRDHVLRAPIPSHQGMTVATILFSVILDQVHMDRDGVIINHAMTKSCIYMLDGLHETEEDKEESKLYLTSFEPEFLKSSEIFYEAEGRKLLQNANAGFFCEEARRRINKELDLCRSTLSSVTAPKIKSVVESQLIKNNIREVIELEGSGVKFMLDNDRHEELENIYDLVSRVDPKKEELKKAIQKRVIEQGTDVNNAAAKSSQVLPSKDSRLEAMEAEGEGKGLMSKPINQQTAAAVQWVDDVLGLKDKYDTVLMKAFQSDQAIQTSLSRSFTDFVNAFDRSSEFLSLFFDENMKKGIKGKTEHEVDILLDKGITLLRYVQDKDMFERYYKKHLSRRLLMKRSISMDAERQMISKMKMEVGNAFTQRIEAMFKDMAVSADLSSAYKNYVARLGDPDPRRAELDVNVLTSTMWPLESMAPSYRDGEGKPNCIFPINLERIKLGFENFYLDKHSGRKLTWQANLGTADLRATFPETKSKIKTRELNVSTYGTIILLLFNDLPKGDSLTCEEIQAKTNIPLYELTRNLQSLAVAPKTRILIKEPMSKDVKLEDKFYFNEGFHSQFAKIKIGVVTGGNKVEDRLERKETEKKNDETRAMTIEAAIVRIMKQRKELSHQQLITETIQILNARFMPDVNMVKKQISSLIERDYLERVEESDPPAYRYLA